MEKKIVKFDLRKIWGARDRVHYVRGGKLARFLNAARSAITVNSTAGQQVLWRGIPLKIFGRAIYDKPELSEFFLKRQNGPIPKPIAIFVKSIPSDEKDANNCYAITTVEGIYTATPLSS